MAADKAIERAKSPAYLERLYLAFYYYDQGQFDRALLQHKLGAIEDKSEYSVTMYLALASELGERIDPELLADLKERANELWVRRSLVWYLLLEGRVQEALAISEDPQSEPALSNRVSLLCAIGDSSAARAIAAAGLRSSYSESFHRLYLTMVAQDWDDSKILDEAKGFGESASWASQGPFFLGIKYLGRQELLKARGHFQRCVDFRIYNGAAHVWARALARRLERLTTWPPEKSQ